MLTEKLRDLADELRKKAEEQKLPEPIPNPVASRARGDMGSMDYVAPGYKNPVKGLSQLSPKLPSLPKK
jgi:hypothetical protein